MTQTRHCLATLRKALGMTQGELANLVECATVTIKAIELGKLKLSVKLAERISAKTGVHLQWLQENNPKAPITDVRGKPFTFETFEKTRAEGTRPPPMDIDDIKFVRSVALTAAWRIAGIMAKAYEENCFTVCDYEIFDTCRDLELKFGTSNSVRRDATDTIKSPTSFAEVEKWLIEDLEKLRSKREAQLKKNKPNGNDIKSGH